ncbi:MAG: 3-phosphoshikimate 1-carboxyvinyltransferase [Polyangiales bacterium]
MPSRLRIARSGPLSGEARVAGDLHIGQQALVWAALADGPSVIAGLAPRRDHRLLADALRALGVGIEVSDHALHVDGVGLRGLRMPKGALDAGDSPTTLALLGALLAGQRFGTRIEARGVARAAELRTLIVPLRARGAQIAGTSGDEGALHAPVAVAPLLDDERLDEVEIAIPNGDATTKLALLVSGLYARGVSAVHEGLLSRDHVERALLALDLSVQTAAGMTVLDTSEAEPVWPGFSWRVPGDFTLASFVIAAALSVPGSDVRIRDLGLNPMRTAFLDALRGTGARVRLAPKGDTAGGEPFGDLRAAYGPLASIRVGGERALGLLDELPALTALAGACRGRMAIRDVGVLRTQAPDALRATIDVLARFGVRCTVYDDGLELDPPEHIAPAHLDADVPPPQALLGCVLALCADGISIVDAPERLDALYPGFIDTLIALGAPIVREGAP